MGEKALEQFRFSFNRSIRLEARPERLSSDGGTLLIREIDERLRVTRDLAARLIDPRDQDLVIHPLVELLRTSISLIAQGWGDQDDADKLRDDPACRLAVSNRKGDSPLRSPNEGQFTPDGLASQPTLSRMIGTVAIDENREKTRKMLLTSAGRDVRATNSGHRLRYVDLDVDSIPLKVEGHQEGAKYNGHYQCRCYHPLVASIAQTGDVVDMKLREPHARFGGGRDRVNNRSFLPLSTLHQPVGFRLTGSTDTSSASISSSISPFSTTTRPMMGHSDIALREGAKCVEEYQNSPVWGITFRPAAKDSGKKFTKYPPPFLSHLWQYM